jgi:hypothetical protein
MDLGAAEAAIEFGKGSGLSANPGLFNDGHFHGIALAGPAERAQEL